MKEIPLTQGKVALVDDEDYQLLSQHKWCAWRCGPRYYAVRSGGYGKPRIMMHRQILGLPNGLGKQDHVDHANRRTLDNRRSNLRRCNPSQNSANASKIVGTASRFRGVFRNNRHWWMARIKVNQIPKYLGNFKTEEEAAEEYNRAARHYFGEFAYQNAI